MKKSKNRNSAGGKALASIKGYHRLLSLWSHKKISKSEFNRQKKQMLAKLKKR